MTSPHRTLGRSQVRVSPLGFGAAPLGNLYSPLDEETARAAVDTAWDAGVRYFDTAPHYGLGLSERRLGAALRARPRAEFTVSTKVGRLLEPHPSPTGSDLAAGGFAVPGTLRRRPDYSRDGVLRSLEASLERLGLDRIDLALVHDPDEHMDTALAEALPALTELRAQGVVGAIGIGMNSVEPLRRFVAEGDPDVVMVAGRWTLLDRTAAPLLAECAAREVSVIAAAPFNSGLLSTDHPGAGGRYDYGTVPAAVLDRARSLATRCAEHGVPLPRAALCFPLREPVVACVLAGFRTPAEVSSAATHLTHGVPEHLWAELNATD
ncbi:MULTISPECIES: aldo/keto reductase [unclassified Streptomyces]|uniref:aldo/keto reductase n=1 Tax=unclassified Streptomyces TaxID=2593676 RepID=UPI002554A346|nr:MULTISPECIES: aldo/keto reductase [unclassified Streptomyces]WRZ62568.1 aldo/keto reductase [Streptomyces sp. NBC_01257]